MRGLIQLRTALEGRRASGRSIVILTPWDNYYDRARGELGLVKGICEILGLDPLYVANEGKLIAVGAAEIADAIVAGLRKYSNGRDARVIGEVKAEPRGMVVLETVFGRTPIVDMLVGEQAPRIC